MSRGEAGRARGVGGAIDADPPAAHMVTDRTRIPQHHGGPSSISAKWVAQSSPCRDGTRHSQSEQRCGLSHDRRRNAEGAGSLEGRVPSRPCGLQRARCVEMELDIPRVSSVAAYHTTAGETQKVLVPWRAEFHLGHVGCGEFAVSRWNSPLHPRFAQSVQTEPVSAMIPIRIDRLRGTGRHRAHQRAAKPTAWIDPIK